MNGNILYVLTDEKLSGRSNVDVAREAFIGGADIVQLRDKNASKEKLIDDALRISDISKEYGKTFIVNDNLFIAMMAADGVHLGKSDGSIREARMMAGDDFIIGASVDSVEDAVWAEREGANYVALSPVFDTQSKSDAGPGHGIDMLSKIVKAVKIPVFGIGGINLDNVGEVMDAGASGVAVISSVICREDIAAAAKEMKEKIKASTDRR